MDQHPKANYLCMCVIVRGEDEYIREWVAFHLALGVDKVLIIDNGSRNLNVLLGAYLDAGRVEIVRFTSRRKTQRGAYDRALRYLEGKFTWVGFFDIDEFVFPSRGNSLPEILRKYEDFSGLAVNWVSFGSSGHSVTPDGWVIENYTERGELDHIVPLPQLKVKSSATPGLPEYKPINTHVKCFVQPLRTEFFRTAHHFRYRPGSFAVTENRTPIEGPLSETVSVDVIRANHYWSKSLEELDKKLSKGRISQQKGKKTSGYDRREALERESASRGVKDELILKHLAQAKAIDSEFPVRTPHEFLPSPRRLRFGIADWLADLSRSAQRKLRYWMRRRRTTRTPNSGRY